MSICVYKVSTRKSFKTRAGQVFLSSFAYQPSKFLHDPNEKQINAIRRAVCRAWDNMPADVRKSVMITEHDTMTVGGNVYERSNFGGLFYDQDLGEERMPLIGMIVQREDGLHVISHDHLDSLWRWNTAFKSTYDVLRAGGNYRPSCDVSEPNMLLLADAYDSLAIAHKDPRRAFRSGETRAR